MAIQQLMSVRDVMARIGVGKTAVYDAIKRGDLPPPVKIGGSARWIPEEIEDAIESAKEKRNEPALITRRGRPRKLVG